MKPVSFNKKDADAKHKIKCMSSNPLAYNPKITNKRNVVESYAVKLSKKGKLSSEGETFKKPILRSKTVVECLS